MINPNLATNNEENKNVGLLYIIASAFKLISAFI